MLFSHTRPALDSLMRSGNPPLPLAFRQLADFAGGAYTLAARRPSPPHAAVRVARMPSPPPARVDLGLAPLSSRKPLPDCSSRFMQSTTPRMHAASHAPTFLVVHCCQMDASWQYIYAPVVGTLVKGVAEAMPRWKVHTLLLRNLSSAPLQLEEMEHLEWPDVAVCIGPLGCPSMPMHALRSRSVLTVHYQTEPLHLCSPLFHSVDEVWDFSWHNIATCAASQSPGRMCAPEARVRNSDCLGTCASASGSACGSASGSACAPSWNRSVLACTLVYTTKRCTSKVMRYVPLGALNSTRGASTYRIASRQPASSARPAQLVFLGQSRYRADSCLSQLRGQLRASYDRSSEVVTRNDVWSDAAYHRLLESSPIFVNLHKSVPRPGMWYAFVRVIFSHHTHLRTPSSVSSHREAKCGDSHNPVTFRFAKLLSEGALLISERCDARDEAELHGLVTFARFDDIGVHFARMMRLGDTERSQLASQAQRRFFERFAPADIVRRAGITSLLGARAPHSSGQQARHHPASIHHPRLV